MKKSLITRCIHEILSTLPAFSNDLRLNVMTRCRDQTFVTINIDDHENEGKQTFMLHRGLLRSQSPYFAAAFKKHFREAVDRSIHLPDVCGATMRLFQFWLYGRATSWPTEYYIENIDAPSSDSAKDGKGKSARNSNFADLIR